MECLLSFLFLLVAFLFVAGSAARSHSIRARRRRLYQQLARRYAGVYLPGGIWRRASVRLRYGETLATLSEAKGRGPFRERCTQIGIVWPDQQFCCEVLPCDMSEAAPRLRHFRDYSTGDNGFDRRFRLRVRDEKEAPRFFREGVRWQIERLASLSAVQPVYVLVRGGQILIQTPRRGCRPEELQAFVDRAFEFYDQVMLTARKASSSLATLKPNPWRRSRARSAGKQSPGTWCSAAAARRPITPTAGTSSAPVRSTGVENARTRSPRRLNGPAVPARRRNSPDTSRRRTPLGAVHARRRRFTAVCGAGLRPRRNGRPQVSRSPAGSRPALRRRTR